MVQKRAPAGRQGEQSIRKMLAAIRRAMTRSEASPRELLQLLRHQERLAAELKEVAKEKLRNKLAALDGSGTSQSEVVG